jgi:hypothetical protein
VHRVRGTLGGQEEFIFKKSFRSEFDEILETQGVHGRLKCSRRSILEGITQGVHGKWTYSKS